jgi:hypothetical protein
MVKMFKYILTYLVLLVGSLYVYNNYIQVQPSVYQGTTPIFDFKSYFIGEFQGVGISQDWRGKVISRFEINTAGSWDDTKGEVIQVIQDDNKNEDGIERIWKFKQINEHIYQGREDNVIGVAKLEQYGNMVNIKYKRSYNFLGMDWEMEVTNKMYMIDANRVISETLVSKLGIPYFTRIIIYQK